VFRGGDGDGESSEEDEVAVQVRLSSTLGIQETTHLPRGAPTLHHLAVCIVATPQRCQRILVPDVPDTVAAHI